MVEVTLSTAMLSFAGECAPVLVGASTPVGKYTLTSGVLKRVRARSYANASVYRRNVTDGRIHVQPEVYDRLLACCNGMVLEVKP